METKVNNIAEFLALRAESRPNAYALIDKASTGGKKLTFSELHNRTQATADFLVSRGLQAKMKVLLMVPMGVDLITLCFSLFMIGAIPVLIDPGMGIKNFVACVKRTEPQAIIGIPLAHWVKCFYRKVFSSVRQSIVLKKNTLNTRINPFSQPFPIHESDPDDLAAILFTSGSTGSPKGVQYTQGIFRAQVDLIRQQYEIEPGEVDLPLLPVFALFNPALGMTTVIPEMNSRKPSKLDPSKIIDAIQRHQVTNSFGSPVLWGKIANYCETRGITLPSLKRILMAGAPASRLLLQRLEKILPNGLIHTPYGATEVLPLASACNKDILNWVTKPGQGTCLGYPVHSMQVRVIAPNDKPIQSIEDALELPQGQVGEIIAQGPSVTLAYDNLPEATHMAKIASKDGLWHRMGDLGYFDPQGRLWFCGRKAEQVILENGVLLYPDCCEGIFNEHPSIYRSALIGTGEKAAIVIEPKADLWKAVKKDSKNFIKELQTMAQQHEMTQTINQFFLQKSLPVDVRHNAKIHRLALARHYAKKIT